MFPLHDNLLHETDLTSAGWSVDFLWFAFEAISIKGVYIQYFRIQHNQNLFYSTLVSPGNHRVIPVLRAAVHMYSYKNISEYNTIKTSFIPPMFLQAII